MLEALLVGALFILVGLSFAFMGYPFFRLLLPIWGFISGMALGIQGADALFGSGLLSVSFGVIVGLFVGILFAFIAYSVYSLAVLLFGATIGYMLGQGLMLALGLEYGFMTFAVGLIGAALLTMLFYSSKMPRFLLILLTAMAGAMAVVTGTFVLFGKVPSVMASLSLTRAMVYESPFWFILWGVVAGLGMFAQYSMAKSAENLNEAYDWNDLSTPPNYSDPMSSSYVAKTSTTTTTKKKSK